MRKKTSPWKFGGPVDPEESLKNLQAMPGKTWRVSEPQKQMNMYVILIYMCMILYNCV